MDHNTRPRLDMAHQKSSSPFSSDQKHPIGNHICMFLACIFGQDSAGIYDEWTFSLLGGVLDHEYLFAVWDCAVLGEYGAVA
jgi:hypothetical protein